MGMKSTVAIVLGIVISAASVHGAEPEQLRPASELYAAMAELFEKARDVAKEQNVESVVLLPGLGREGEAVPFRVMLNETLLNSFENKVKVEPPPANMKPPLQLDPTTISRLRWPATGKEKKVPTVLVMVGTRKNSKYELALTLLDDKAVHWTETMPFAVKELAALPVVPELNQKIVEYAMEQKEQKVGNGECWTLGDEALKACKAAHPGTIVWGRKLQDGEPVMPGDIVQFKSVKLQKGSSWQSLGAPGHTAIIAQVTAPNVYVVLHQNYGGARVVKETKLDFSTKTEGEITIFRPKPKVKKS